MKRFIIIQLLAVVFAAQIQAQGDGEIKYRRSSLYSMMINHEGREFGDEIKDVFLKIPVPDKYNNHDLSVKVIYLKSASNLNGNLNCSKELEHYAS